jgi:hypothetical protein
MDSAKTKRQVVELAFIPTGALELAAQGTLGAVLWLGYQDTLGHFRQSTAAA